MMLSFHNIRQSESSQEAASQVFCPAGTLPHLLTLLCLLQQQQLDPPLNCSLNRDLPVLLPIFPPNMF